MKIFKTSGFFSTKEKEQIIQVIQEFECLTSGELRVHVESGNGTDPLSRAKEVYQSLGMTKTALRNGVLIYLAVKDRKFAIIGDQGIDQVVPEGFWDDTQEKMAALFQEGRFVEGVCLGIRLSGKYLAEYFPCQIGDVNELSDEISVGK